MRFLLFPFALAALIALALPTASAQPEGRVLLRAWLADREAALAQTEAATLTESATRTIDGPRGLQRLDTVSRLSLDQEEGLDVQVLRAQLNGDAVPSQRLRNLDRRLSRAYRAGWAWIRRPPFTVQVLRLMRPVGQVTQDRLDGVPVWVVSVVPRRPNDRFERGTLYFAQMPPGEAPRLVRTRLVARLPDGTATATTDYVRVQGLDLPRHHRAEAIVQQQRRLRRFTVLLNTDATYDDLSVVPR